MPLPQNNRLLQLQSGSGDHRGVGRSGGEKKELDGRMVASGGHCSQGWKVA